MNIFDKASQVGDSVSDAISLASSKKEFIGKQIINCVLLLIILLVFGCLDFATLTFHIEYLSSLSYWGTVISKVIAGICAFNIGINMMWETELKKDDVLSRSIKRYNNLITYKDLDFEYYIVHHYNPDEKTKAYISQINHKIYLLNKYSRAKDRLLYSSDLPERQSEKKTNKYCILRQELEDLKNPDFIRKNIDSLKVRYYEVDATVFDLEIDGSAPIHGTKTKGSVTIGKVKASANVVLGMIGFSMFFTAIGLELNGQQFASQMEAFLHYLFKCITDAGIVLWQLARGMLKVRKIISSELTQPYVGRIKVLEHYFKWQLDNDKINIDKYKSITNKVEEIEIEVTQEELNKLQGGN